MVSVNTHPMESRMKKAFAVAALGLLVVGGPAFASAELAKQKNCLACHAVDKKLVGPAWKDVAAKYRGQKGAEAKLVEKVATTRGTTTPGSSA